MKTILQLAIAGLVAFGLYYLVVSPILDTFATIAYQISKGGL